MNFKTTLALAALTVAGVTNASAASLLWDSTGQTGHFTSSTLGPGAFTDDVTFTLSSSYDALAVGANFIQPLTDTALSTATATLYDATTNTVVAGYTPIDFTAGTASELYTNLSAGSYYFLVAGAVTAPQATGSYALKLTLSPANGGNSAVPEPATTALLLAGVGVMAFMSRRRLQK